MNIHQKKTLRWMIGFLVLLAGIWKMVTPHQMSPDRTYIFPGVENANIQQLNIDDASFKLSLVRSQERWEIDGNANTEVDYALVEGMLTKLLQASRSEPLDSSDPKQFGLEPAKLRLTLIEGDGTEHLLKIGNPLQVSTDTYISQGTEIFTTAGNLITDWKNAARQIQAMTHDGPPLPTAEPTAVHP
jgi:hypothetical protein